MQVAATTKDAIELFRRGAIALAEVEYAGMRIDVPYFDKKIRETKLRIEELEEALRKDDVWRMIRREYGLSAELGSEDQFRWAIFKNLGYEVRVRTAKMQPSTAAEALKHIDLPYVKNWVNYCKLRDKVYSTYLLGIRKRVYNGFLHPSYHLNFVWTFRSSGSDPNPQNLPSRDGEFAEVVRTGFIPRDDHLIIENDFKAAEVMASAVYQQDPVWIDYCSDSSKDMHRDSAIKLFFLDDVDSSFWKSKEHFNNGKDIRNVAKADYVFASMYGSYYLNCAPRIWSQMRELKLGIGGITLRKHLRNHGISELGDCKKGVPPRPGTFEAHVKAFEDWYWNVQYPVYTRWKREWYEEYLRKGYADYLTGFRVQGIFSRNQMLDAPIQGTSFHWLMWVLIELVTWLRKNKMRSRVIAQIHDSIIGDVHKDEKDDYLAKVRELVSKGLRKQWPWICVPITIEAEVTDVNGNWFKKKQIEF